MYYLSSSLDKFGPEECFLVRTLYQKTGGHMFAPKSGSPEKTGQTCSLNRPDQFGQSPQNVNWNSPLDSSRRVDQDSYIERPIWNPDERDMVLGSSAPRAYRSPVHMSHPEIFKFQDVIKIKNKTTIFS